MPDGSISVNSNGVATRHLHRTKQRPVSQGFFYTKKAIITDCSLIILLCDLCSFNLIGISFICSKRIVFRHNISLNTRQTSTHIFLPVIWRRSVDGALFVSKSRELIDRKVVAKKTIIECLIDRSRTKKWRTLINSITTIIISDVTNIID